AANHSQRIVEILGGCDNSRLAEVSRMGHQRIGETMLAAVRGGVGMSRGAQQRQSHDRALDVVAVLAVVEQCDAVAWLAQVSPPVGANLKARLVPAGVGMRASLDVTELDLVRRPR